ncbi:MAG: hypothetical protein AAF637_03390, partial [Pseudomonadota bacterium]
KANVDAALVSLERKGVLLNAEQRKNLINVTDQQWREIMYIPGEDLAKFGRRSKPRAKANETLVYNIALHGYDEAMQMKKQVVASARAGLLGPRVTDMRAQKACFTGPNNTTLYGPSPEDLADGVAVELGRAVERGVEDGLSTTFIKDAVKRQLNPVLVDKTDKRTVLGRSAEDKREERHADRAGQRRKLVDFVGDDDGQGDVVAKNLSHYLNQNPVNEVMLRTNQLQLASDQGGTAIVMTDSPTTEWAVQVQEEEDGESYVVSYTANAPINRLMVDDEYPMDSTNSAVSMGMSIRLKRSDLAAGNGKFEYIDKPFYDIVLRDGGNVPDLPSLHADDVTSYRPPTQPTSPTVADNDVPAAPPPFTPVLSNMPTLMNYPTQPVPSQQLEQNSNDIDD